ncbi:[FeFe] hydrogenase H-cluster maturation GTPase HydF [Aristaeella hokkaidonensis]|uniref:[FeFe] hydrogenase H-cluster maturation GTPase HydF n=1 Tax=Aristaeella hokkaidonensis TaxID=3046382 RepID=A0AC61MVD5_9FIRM|nr:[FeFe] hydrogenase H-cluster maturation GTPase HydF [Aristaeella hokkaidonensis]QUC66462.1 [FeFe] hydrogenase H-cluster maturation GTPase HydF [Aristaeella hokkaidonensis]SNT94125.1 [FeFe] hydrogenase H-cluster maturation GTPase HydF [Aristaeella hokkaidonensis]
MSLNETPSGERTHIGFFGARNAGKSSLVNAVTGQELAVVSEVKGTTTDPVRKAMELLPLGPVVIIDTPGFDDEGSLGLERVKKTREILRTCDIAVLVVDAGAGLSQTDRELLDLIREREIPSLTVWNKTDLAAAQPAPEGAAEASSLTGVGITELKERLARLIPEKEDRKLAGDLVFPGDLCVLVCPIDESAPKGRLILPQQQTIRDLMDRGAIPVVCRDTELETVLKKPGLDPALVITDSQAFRTVSAIVPDELPLTSFSILMARYKGFLETAVKGISAAKNLRDGDRVLLAEGCTHHRQCNDIGTVKIPRWLRQYTGKELTVDTCSGREFPEDLTPYQLVIHCGGCMLTENAVLARMNQAIRQGVPFTNYGIAIAFMTGALERSLRLFPALHSLLTGGGS